MRDTDWRPSPCPYCGVMRSASANPICLNKDCKGSEPMTTYGPRIAHQGGDECPCDRYVAGRVWYVGNTKENNYVLMLEADWSRVLVYQLAVEPVRETVVRECWAFHHADVTRFAYCNSTCASQGARVRITTNLEDGLPVSGSWEAVE